MKLPKFLGNVLIGATAVIFAGGRYIPDHDKSGPVLTAAVEFVSPKTVEAAPTVDLATSAVQTFGSMVHGLSHPSALQNAFRSYFAYKSSHPADVKKPYLYFVDYGLAATKPRGYVFDMEA